ncbi:MAG: GTPase HflX [Angelakisella sp.]|mgnify:FL=1|jgi:GTP-binding protein HflX|nr:GTPase HflX [Angelakisella sp.]
MYENDTQYTPLAVLAGVDTGAYDMDASMEELRELAASAGYESAGILTQKRPEPDAATCLGAGRLEELAEFVRNSGADAVIFDHELSPLQIRNLEQQLDRPVIDRTMLILDIFAQRAVSAEGKLQVELAQLRYQLPRLAGRGVQLSRQGGGGGGGGGARRGAGESKKEVDRRHIQRRITALSRQLEELAQRRQRLRERRRKDGVTTVAIVGYTNVGKSTLLNALTQAGVLAEDKLFATLDPTARGLELPDGRRVMLIDTVGLLRRLPHHLVEAFRSTLEEAAQADLILSVCDAASGEAPQQMAVTRELLAQLGAERLPVLTVLNKCDLLPELPQGLEGDCVPISARTGAGLPELLEAVARALPPSHLRAKLLLPYSAGELEARILRDGKIFLREYTPQGVQLEANVPVELIHLVKEYIIG